MTRLVAKAFVSPNPVRTMVCVIITGAVAFVISNLAVRTFIAVVMMAVSGEAKAFSEVWADPLEYGAARFFIASAFGALGGAVSYVRDQNRREWETASIRTFVGHMIVAQFAAVLAFLIAVWAEYDNVAVLILTGFAGFLGDRFLDRADPVFDRLLAVFSSGKRDGS